MDILNVYDLETCRPHIVFSDTSYKRVRLAGDAEHDLILICWKKGQVTPVHDHPDGGCWMKVLQGSLEETEVSAADLQPFRVHIHQPPACGFKRGRHPLHRIRALEDSVSLHVYKPGGYIARTY